jgi:Pvc16 N-terminal domain
MIHEAVKFITNNLNDFLKIESNVNEQMAVANSIVNADAIVTPNNENKLVLTLLNISEENLPKNFSVPNTDIIHQNKKLILSFYLLISSNFNDYIEGLRFLDAAFSFFEAQTIFNEATSKNFPTDFDNIQVHFQTTSFEQLHFIWSTIGASYQPSMLYKIKMVHR